MKSGAWYAALAKAVLYSEEGENMHSWALALLVLRLFEGFSMWETTRWLPTTLALSFGKLLNFLIMFLFCVYGFAILCYAKFGAYFYCFHTVRRSVTVLMLYCVGLYDPYSTHIHIFEEVGAWDLTKVLAMYMVAVVMI